MLESVISSETVPKVHLKLRIDEVNWNSVTELLERRFHLSVSQARKLCAEFSQRFLTPLEPSWFRNPCLPSDYNCLLAAVCEVHGGDTILMTNENSISIGPLKITHRLEINFIPTLRHVSRKESQVRCEPKIELVILGRQMQIHSVADVVRWRSIAFLSALALIVPFLGCLFYGLAVFMVFIELPAETTITALNNGHIGLALLCFLVGFAGLFGRALVNTVGKIGELLRR